MQAVLSSISFLIRGALVMWMCAGSMMLKVGSVCSKNTSAVCLKNIRSLSIAALIFYVVAYNFMYVNVGEGGWFETFDLNVWRVRVLPSPV